MHRLTDDKSFTAYIGIDWADTKHDACLQAAGSEQREFTSFSHQVDRIEAWAHSMHQRFGGPIAVVLELSKGPIVYALQKYEFFVLFPVNPSTLAKYREALTPSRAKDDPTDAELALDLLMRHPERFKALKPQSVEMRTLVSLVEQRRYLVNDRIRITNRLRSALKQYYPQTLEWFDRIDTLIFCDFISRWPTLLQVKRARRSTLERFFHVHNMRFAHVLEARLKSIKAATALTLDEAVVTPHRLQALPGAGPQLAPRLLAAFGEQRERFKNAAELQQYAGIAPVTERSGKKHWVHWRWQCPTLRQTFVEWAAQTINKSFWAGAFYSQQRTKGCSHQAAVRALAFKWIRILYRCWATRTTYNEAEYLRALERRGSPLLQQFATSK